MKNKTLILAALTSCCTFMLFPQPFQAQKKNPTKTGGAHIRKEKRAQKQSSSKSSSERKELDESDVIRVSTALINIPAIVTDRKGKYVVYLGQEDFHIY